LKGVDEMKNATLRAELARHGIKRKDLAQLLRLSESALQGKLQGRRSFWLAEAYAIQQAIKSRGGDIALNELFKESIEEEIQRLAM
jgi:transcriptional regulator with XRE-family HTH domain